jgi:hypothetical protein
MLDGNRGFDVTNPDGHDVEFIQYMPGSPAQPELRQVPAGHPGLNAEAECGMLVGLRSINCYISHFHEVPLDAIFVITVVLTAI